MKLQAGLYLIYIGISAEIKIEDVVTLDAHLLSYVLCDEEERRDSAVIT